MARRGESLIEVVVACGVIMLVFSGVLTLVVQSVNLNLSARDRTKAITAAQLRLNNFLIQGRELDPTNANSTYQTTFDSGACLVGVTNASLNTSLDQVGEDYGCQQNSTSDSLLRPYLASIRKTECGYLHVRNLLTSSPDETSAGIINTNKYEMVESHEFWVSQGQGLESFVLTRLVRIN